MKTKYTISFIGSGNLATNLALALHQAEHQVNEVYSRNSNHAEFLSGKLTSCSPKNELDFSKSESEIFIIAVSDHAIHEILEQLKIPENSVVVHTSGSTPIDIFSILSSSIRTGIFYPLQTFNKDNPIDFSNLPILYESKNERTNQILDTLGRSISSEVKFVTSEDRKTIHLAAVFASNFTNRMLGASKEILSKKNFDLKLLEPLVEQSIKNCFEKSPEKALTGPAKRKDLVTIDEHLKMLAANPELKSLYEKISSYILNKK